MALEITDPVAAMVAEGRELRIRQRAEAEAAGFSPQDLAFLDTAIAFTLSQLQGQHREIHRVSCPLALLYLQHVGQLADLAARHNAGPCPSGHRGPAS